MQFGTVRIGNRRNDLDRTRRGRIAGLVAARNFGRGSARFAVARDVFVGKRFRRLSTAQGGAVLSTGSAVGRCYVRARSWLGIGLGAVLVIRGLGIRGLGIRRLRLSLGFGLCFGLGFGRLRALGRVRGRSGRGFGGLL